MSKDLKTTVDEDLYSEVAALADSMDESKAEIQRRALRAYIDGGAPEPTDTPTTFSDKLDDICDHNLEDGPHDISLARDPDVDWTSKEVVSRTYNERLPVLNAWLNDEAEAQRVDDETLDEMLTDEEVGFGLVRQTGYSDRKRLQEYGIAFPSPAVDPAWDRGDLLRRCHEIKARETKTGDINRKPSSLDELLEHKVEYSGVVGPVWCFDKVWVTNDALLVSMVRQFIGRLTVILEETDTGSSVHEMYRVVLEDFVEYLREKDLMDDWIVDKLEQVEDQFEESVRESVKESWEQMEQAESAE